MAGYEELYARSYTELLQQTFLLTGDRRRAAGAVRRAFGAAWNQWDVVAADPDPQTWLRVRAFDTALSPWRPGGPRRTHVRQVPHLPIRVAPLATPADGVPAAKPAAGTGSADAGALTDRDRALLTALGRISRPRRRALVLHDALGLSVRAIAAEVEASTAGAEQRVRAARAELARSVPALVGTDPTAEGFAPLLGGLLYRAAVRGCPPPGPPPLHRRPAAPRSTRPLRVAARLRAAALPTAATLLVLATVGAVGGTLAGHGPSALFTPRPTLPVPLCTTAANGSAVPAAPAAAPGLHSLWCRPAWPAATPAAPTAPLAPATPVAPADQGTDGATDAPTDTSGDPATAGDTGASQDSVQPGRHHPLVPRPRPAPSGPGGGTGADSTEGGPRAGPPQRCGKTVNRSIRGWTGSLEDRRTGLRVSARPYRP
ncbi:hypothetical protein GCM10009665_77570 [Kitasatospora nipponensis]|uniref:RNA polymerase sigma factor 70 region 4 type 2 domain-containing protein n=1 Tax=Kitasatospora nipponensis TaxID=258049 RepID=A0ABN1T906_9ACTN